jgi:sucrose hydrolase-like protein
VHNLAHEAREAKLRLGDKPLTNLADLEEIHASPDGVHRVTLDAHGYRWLRLGETNQALGREVVD